MKTSIFKSIGLFLSGALVSFLLSSSIEKSEKKQDGLPPYYESTAECTTGKPNQVCLTVAQKNILEYRMWLKYLPSSVELDTHTYQLSFNPVQIQEVDQSDIIDIVRLFWQNNDHFHYPNLPFHGVRDHAFFIEKSDIMEAFSVVEKSNSIDTANGIRVYMATEGLKEHQALGMESHLYVVPTYLGKDSMETGLGTKKIESIDFIPHFEGQHQYVFDLTTPCPAYCDPKSALNLPGWE